MVLPWAYYPNRDNKFQRLLLGLSCYKSPYFLNQAANVGVLLVAEYVYSNCMLKNQENTHKEDL